jgi:hypothetical protein
MKNSLYLIILLTVLIIAYFTVVEPSQPKIAVKKLEVSQKFENTFKRPEWFKSTEWVKISNEKEMSKLWQSEKRCCQNKFSLNSNFKIFYKSCYNGILENYNDNELVVKCLWLMGFEKTKEQNSRLKKFIYENYFNHNSRVDNCANCMIGDIVARSTLSLSQYNKRENINYSVEILEKIIDKRGHEVSYWIQLDIYSYLIRLYSELPKINKIQKERINNGLFNLRKNLIKERYKETIKKLEKEYNKILEK